MRTFSRSLTCSFCTSIFFAFVFNSKKCHLFPDAEIGKYIAQHLVVGHFADDFAKVVDGGAEVFADEVAAEAEVEAVLYFLYLFKGAGEGFVVAHIGDNDVAA